MYLTKKCTFLIMPIIKGRVIGHNHVNYTYTNTVTNLTIELWQVYS